MKKPIRILLKIIAGLALSFSTLVVGFLIYNIFFVYSFDNLKAIYYVKTNNLPGIEGLANKNVSLNMECFLFCDFRWPILDEAIRLGHTKIAQKIIDSGVKLKKENDWIFNVYVYKEILENNDSNTIDFLLKNKFDPRTISFIGQNCNKRINKDTFYKNYSHVYKIDEHLLSYSSTSEKDKFQINGIDCAIIASDDIEIIKKFREYNLLEEVAQPRTSNNFPNCSYISLAIYLNKPNVAKYLVSQNPINVDKSCFEAYPRNIMTHYRGNLLFKVIENDMGTDLFKALIENGADINFKTTQNGRNITPSHYAVILEKPKYLKILVDYGANINEVDHDGKNVTYYASMSKSCRNPDCEMRKILSESFKSKTNYIDL